jgi:hypothetical protein
MNLTIVEYNTRFMDLFEIFNMFNGDKNSKGRKARRTFEETMAEAEKMGINIVPGKKIKKKPLFKK